MSLAKNRQTADEKVPRAMQIAYRPSRHCVTDRRGFMLIVWAEFNAGYGDEDFFDGIGFNGATKTKAHVPQKETKELKDFIQLRWVSKRAEMLNSHEKVIYYL